MTKPTTATTTTRKALFISGTRPEAIKLAPVIAACRRSADLEPVLCATAQHRQLLDEITALGGRAIMWKVGHSLIKVKMKEEQAALAGEMSGHMFFADRWYGFDDAVYAGARLIELLSRSPQTLAEHYDTLPALYNTPEIRLECPEEIKFEVVRKTVAWFRERYPIVDVDGVRVRFEENGRSVGWGLVRASNTGPVLVLRFEADTAARLASIRGLVEDRLRQIIAETTA